MTLHYKNTHLSHFVYDHFILNLFFIYLVIQEYGSFANAVDKPNGLCVLGSFIDVGAPHEGMAPLFDQLVDHCQRKYVT